MWLLPAFVALRQRGWKEVVWECCMHGAEYCKPTTLLCCPEWQPDLERRCRWDNSTGRYTCGHTDKRGPRPHTTLGGDGLPTHLAAEYADGLVEAWALEVARYAETRRLVSAPGLLHADAPLRVARHPLRGIDPESQRERRERENRDCRAGPKTRWPWCKRSKRAAV